MNHRFLSDSDYDRDLMHSVRQQAGPPAYFDTLALRAWASHCTREYYPALHTLTNHNHLPAKHRQSMQKSTRAWEQLSHQPRTDRAPDYKSYSMKNGARKFLQQLLWA